MGSRSVNHARFVSQTSGFSNSLGTVGGNDSRHPAISATGGTKATPGDGYIYHHITSTGPFNVTGGAGNKFDYLIVGGGGGGGYDRGGGGGGGGVYHK